MNKLTQWSKTWTIPQALVACFSITAITSMCIVLTLRDAWLPLLHWLAQPESSALLIGIVSLAVTLYHRALGLPPTMPVEVTSDAETTPVERPKRNAGFAAIELVCWLAVVGSLAVLAMLHGCSPSQLQTQSAATVVAMHAVHISGDAVHADEERVRDACADDACMAANRAAHHPAELAIDALRTAVLAWMDAIAVALVAEDETAEAAIATAWQAVIARAGDVVHELMDAGLVIPPMLAALIPGAS